MAPGLSAIRKRSRWLATRLGRDDRRFGILVDQDGSRSGAHVCQAGSRYHFSSASGRSAQTEEP